MPCYTVSNSQVAFDMEHTDVDLLKAALENMGYTVRQKGKELTFSGTGYDYLSGSFKNGKVEVEFNSRNKFDVNAVKRAYSQEVVRFASKRFGWNLKTKDEKGLQFEAVKRF